MMVQWMHSMQKSWLQDWFTSLTLQKLVNTICETALLHTSPYCLLRCNKQLASGLLKSSPSVVKLPFGPLERLQRLCLLWPCLCCVSWKLMRCRTATPSGLHCLFYTMEQTTNDRRPLRVAYGSICVYVSVHTTKSHLSRRHALWRTNEPPRLIVTLQYVRSIEIQLISWHKMSHMCGMRISLMHHYWVQHSQLCYKSVLPTNGTVLSETSETQRIAEVAISIADSVTQTILSRMTRSVTS